MKVERDSVLFGVPVYCRKCKVEWFPTVYLGRELGDERVRTAALPYRPKTGAGAGAGKNFYR